MVDLLALVANIIAIGDKLKAANPVRARIERGILEKAYHEAFTWYFDSFGPNSTDFVMGPDFCGRRKVMEQLAGLQFVDFPDRKVLIAEFQDYRPDGNIEHFLDNLSLLTRYFIYAVSEHMNLAEKMMVRSVEFYSPLNMLASNAVSGVNVDLQEGKPHTQGQSRTDLHIDFAPLIQALEPHIRENIYQAMERVKSAGAIHASLAYCLDTLDTPDSMKYHIFRQVDVNSLKTAIDRLFRDSYDMDRAVSEVQSIISSHLDAKQVNIHLNEIISGSLSSSVSDEEVRKSVKEAIESAMDIDAYSQSVIRTVVECAQIDSHSVSLGALLWTAIYEAASRLEI